MLHTGPACSLEKLKLSEIISPLQYWGHNLMQTVFQYIFVMVIETVYLLTCPVLFIMVAVEYKFLDLILKNNWIIYLVAHPFMGGVAGYPSCYYSSTLMSLRQLPPTNVGKLVKDDHLCSRSMLYQAIICVVVPSGILLVNDWMKHVCYCFVMLNSHH